MVWGFVREKATLAYLIIWYTTASSRTWLETAHIEFTSHKLSLLSITSASFELPALLSKKGLSVFELKDKGSPVPGDK